MSGRLLHTPPRAILLLRLLLSVDGTPDAFEDPFPLACDTAQLPCLTLIRSRPLLSKVYWRQALNAYKYGANFTEWAPKNLQASILVSPLDATWAEYVGK